MWLTGKTREPVVPAGCGDYRVLPTSTIETGTMVLVDQERHIARLQMDSDETVCLVYSPSVTDDELTGILERLRYAGFPALRFVRAVPDQIRYYAGEECILLDAPVHATAIHEQLGELPVVWPKSGT